MPVDMVLEARGLSLKYGDYTAVDGVSLRFGRNRLHSLIGPNGAGKTSFFNLLSGTRMASAGSLVLNGEDVTRRGPDARLHRGLSRSFQITQLFDGLSVHENVRLAVQARHPRQARSLLSPRSRFPQFDEEADAIVERLGLQRLRAQAVDNLSHGQQRLVELAVCLAGRPQVLLLDEPTSGMGVDDIPRMMELIAALAREMTIVLIEHNMGMVLELSDEIAVLAQGKVVAQGTPAEIAGNALVRSIYLGGGHAED